MTTTWLLCSAFALTEQFKFAFFNVPGCVHDSQVVEFGKIYGKLEKLSYNRGMCCFDLAFGSVNRNYWVPKHQRAGWGNLTFRNTDRKHPRIIYFRFYLKLSFIWSSIYKQTFHYSLSGVVHANVEHNVTLLNNRRTAVSYHFSTYERCDNQPQHEKTGKTPRPWWPSRPPLQRRGVDGSARSNVRATRPWCRARSRMKS